MGFLIGVVLVRQILTGLFISILFSAEIDLTFTRVVFIIRDRRIGWVTRVLHSNGASLFFLLIYIHTARGIYFSSPRNQKPV